MKRNNKTWFYSLILTCFLTILISSCKKDSTNNSTTPPSTSPIVFSDSVTYSTVSDIDGNVYKTIVLGTQTWMAENLRTTKYKNGSPIPNVTDNNTWFNLKTAAYCDYNNVTDNSKIYGHLYNWYTVSNNADTNLNVCPTGWRVPADSDWTILTTYLGGVTLAGDHMKEVGTTHWSTPNLGAVNDSGFTAIPAGFRNSTGDFQEISFNAYWWSSTLTDQPDGNSYYRSLDYDMISVYRCDAIHVLGFSVRCIKKQ